jgi:hypothetical protein
MTLAEFARDYLAGKTAKTAKRRVMEDGIPYDLDHGHMTIRQSDAESWRASKRVEPTKQDMKSVLRAISDRALAREKLLLPDSTKAKTSNQRYRIRQMTSPADSERTN